MTGNATRNLDTAVRIVTTRLIHKKTIAADYGHFAERSSTASEYRWRDTTAAPQI
jgi:hypothetical protein